MKKIWITVCLVLFCMSAGSSMANLLQNAGFETEGTNSMTAQYWLWGAPDIHGSYWGSASRENWRSHSGTWEGAIKGSWCGLDSGGWWQESSGKAGVTYSLSAWFWADNSWTNQQTQGMKIEFLSGAQNGQTLLGTVSNSFSGVGETWVQKTVQGVAPEGTTWIRAVIYADGVGAEGALQVDDVELVAEPGTMIILSEYLGRCLPILGCMTGSESLFSSRRSSTK
ncbi:MAG: hypothetical protein V2A34_12145 [Lentisphaerota bacterium]